MVRDGNVFGLRGYIRECGKFKTSNVNFMYNVLGGCSKGFVDRTVFIMYLRRFILLVVATWSCDSQEFR